MQKQHWFPCPGNFQWIEAKRLQVDLAEVQKVFLHTKGLVLEAKEKLYSGFYTESHRSAVTLVDVLTPQWQADMLVAPGYMGRLDKQGAETSYLYYALPRKVSNTCLNARIACQIWFLRYFSMTNSIYQHYEHVEQKNCIAIHIT